MRVFATITKSNSVLISCLISFNNCSDLEDIIYCARKDLQDLLKSTVILCSGISASCMQSITDSQSPLSALSKESIFSSQSQPTENKKAKEFFQI